MYEGDVIREGREDVSDAPSNRALVGDALDLLFRVLMPYVEERMRAAYGDQWLAEEGFSLTYLPFIARAVIDGLDEFPHLNASVSGSDGVDDNVFHITMSPTAEYFVKEGLAVGGGIGLTYMTQGDARSTSLTLAPSATWFLRTDGDGPHPFLRGAVRWGRTSFSSDFGDSDGSTWGFGAGAGPAGQGR